MRIMSDSKVTVLIHPVRLRIASLFGARELTTKQISDALPDIPQGSLYRHIKKMIDVGLLQITKELPVRGVIERFYRFNYQGAVFNAEDAKSYSSESLKSYYITLVVDLMREINECIDMPDYKIETHGPRFLKTYRFTSSKDRVNMVEKLLSTIRETSEPEPSDEKKRTMITFAIMSVP